MVVDLPGVGENLQDRYEVGVISEFERPSSCSRAATFAPPEKATAPPTRSVVQWENGHGRLRHERRADRHHQTLATRTARARTSTSSACPASSGATSPATRSSSSASATSSPGRCSRPARNNTRARDSCLCQTPGTGRRIDFQYFARGQRPEGRGPRCGRGRRQVRPRHERAPERSATNQS